MADNILHPDWPAHIDLKRLTQLVKEKVSQAPPFGATLIFRLDEGSIFIDGTGTANLVSNQLSAAQCTIKLKMQDFVAMLRNRTEPLLVFMEGKLKVEGDLSLASQLPRLFPRN